MTTLTPLLSDSERIWDPIHVLAQRGGLTTGATAIWQVETISDMTLGQRSGAWLVTGDGVQGFAANADWIPGREDPDVITATILRFPVFLCDAGSVLPTPAASHPLRVIDWEATVAAMDDALTAMKEDFLTARGPAAAKWSWSAVGELRPYSTDIRPDRDTDSPAPDSSSPAPTDADSTPDAEAIAEALAWARGLQEAIQHWNALEKDRLRRWKVTLRWREKNAASLDPERAEEEQAAMERLGMPLRPIPLRGTIHER